LFGLVALAERLHEHDAGVGATRGFAQYADPAIRAIFAGGEARIRFEFCRWIEGNEFFTRAQAQHVAQVVRRFWV